MEINDHELVIVKPDNVTIEEFDGTEKKRDSFKVDMDPSAADKGTYPFYMLKEIDEQPAVMRKLVQEYFDSDDQPQISEKLLQAMAESDHIYIIGAGTSYHAGLIGARMFEKLVACQLRFISHQNLPMSSRCLVKSRSSCSCRRVVKRQTVAKYWYTSMSTTGQA